MIISPIFYMGNKKRLIRKGLIELFPKDIDTFVDLFCGSAIVSMNTKANKYILNEIDVYLINLYKLFMDKNSEDIISHIENRIEEFELPKERTKRNVYQGDLNNIEKYKKAYMKFRNYYNNNKNVLDFYTLMFFSFSQQFRFNKNGNFNMPYGSDYFSENNKTYIINGCDFFSNKNIEITTDDFRNFNISKLCNNDFVYLDPPYLNTTATYNEQNGWTINEEKALYEFCEKLNENNIKFALSNIFENKGNKNEYLINWCKQNNWNVYTFNKFSYCACGIGDSNTKEVLITNY